MVLKYIHKVVQSSLLSKARIFSSLQRKLHVQLTQSLRIPTQT